MVIETGEFPSRNFTMRELMRAMALILRLICEHSQLYEFSKPFIKEKRQMVAVKSRICNNLADINL